MSRLLLVSALALVLGGCLAKAGKASNTPDASQTSAGGSTGASTATGGSNAGAHSTGTSGGPSGTSGAATSGSFGTGGTSGSSGSSAASSASGTLGTVGSTGTSGAFGSTGFVGGTTGGTANGTAGGTTGSPLTAGAETCVGAPALSLGDTVQGDTTAARNDYDPVATSCNQSDDSGGDVVFSFTPSVSADFQFTLVPSGFDGALYVVEGCPATLSGCVGGEDNGGTGEPEVLRVTLAAGTTYSVVVDGYQGSAGPFSLRVDRVVPPANDTCSSAIALYAGVLTSGDLTFAYDDLQPAGCGTTSLNDQRSAGDVVFTFTPTDTGRYRFTMTPDATLDPVIYVATACAAGPLSAPACIGGADDHNTGVAEVLEVGLSAGVTYTVVADAYSGSTGAFTLLVEELPPPPAGDTCATAVQLASHSAASAPEEQRGDLSNALDDTYGSCGGYPGNDVVYALTLTEQVSLTARVDDGDGGPFPGVLFLTSSCGDPVSELRCAQGAPLSLPRLGEADGGTYFLWVDGTYGDNGPYRLTVQLGAPLSAPTNDLCLGALPLVAGQPVTGDTTAATDDYRADDGTCHAFGTDGNDVVYAFTPPAPGQYLLRLQPEADFDAKLYVIDSCPSTASINHCVGGSDNAGPGAEERVQLGADGGETFLIVVDGYATGSGSFTLSAESYMPLPGDSCEAGPLPLALAALPDGGLTGQATLDTRQFADDSSSDEFGLCGGSGRGGDAVFAVQLAASVPSLSATLEPDPDGGLRGLLYLRAGPCADSTTAPDGGSTSQELACGDGYYYSSATLTAGPLSAGTYYLWVDAHAGNDGPGTVTVTVP